jgi:flagellar basal body-associated protein FliL
MDYFFRYAYLATFALYIAIFMSQLYNLIWLYIVSIVLFILSIFIYIFYHVNRQKQKTDWSYKKSCAFYMRLKCIFPK